MWPSRIALSYLLLPTDFTTFAAECKSFYPNNNPDYRNTLFHSRTHAQRTQTHTHTVTHTSVPLAHNNRSINKQNDWAIYLSSNTCCFKIEYKNSWLIKLVTCQDALIGNEIVLLQKRKLLISFVLDVFHHKAVLRQHRPVLDVFHWQCYCMILWWWLTCVEGDGRGWNSRQVQWEKCFLSHPFYRLIVPSHLMLGKAEGVVGRGEEV